MAGLSQNGNLACYGDEFAVAVAPEGLDRTYSPVEQVEV
jgi:hypothetical protein